MIEIIMAHKLLTNEPLLVKTVANVVVIKWFGSAALT